MKRHLPIFIAALLPVVTACAEARQSEAAATAAQVSADPVGDVVEQLRLTKFDKREAISPACARMNQQIDEQIARWRAAGRQFSPQTHEQLRVARADAAEKISALALATPETWTTVKEHALVALANVRGALYALDTYSSK